MATPRSPIPVTVHIVEAWGKVRVDTVNRSSVSLDPPTRVCVRGEGRCSTLEGSRSKEALHARPSKVMYSSHLLNSSIMLKDGEILITKCHTPHRFAYGRWGTALTPKTFFLSPDVSWLNRTPQHLKA